MLSNGVRWFLTTATIVGVPVTIAIILVGVERSFHTLTCETARYGCSRSFVHSLDYVVEQVTPDNDVTLTPRKKSKGY
jgi:hypothetical protein